MDIRPGEFVMCTLFADFTVQAEKKMEAVMAEPLVLNIHNFLNIHCFYLEITSANNNKDGDAEGGGGGGGQ
jgi:hypothetical protein